MLNKDEIASLEATHGRIARIVVGRSSGNPTEVIFRKPKRAEFKMFRAKVHNPSQKAEAQETLARQCCIVPTREAFDALLEDYPAICDSEQATSLFEKLMSDAVEEDGK